MCDFDSKKSMISFSSAKELNTECYKLMCNF